MNDYSPTGLTKRVANDLGFHPATEETKPKHEAIRRKAKEFAEFLIETCPPGRELSLALTEVQLAAMWGNAAVAVNLAPLES